VNVRNWDLSSAAQELLNAPAMSEVCRELNRNAHNESARIGVMEWTTLEDLRYAQGIVAGIKQAAAMFGPA